MENLDKKILEVLNKQFAGKFLDNGPSGMQIISFSIHKLPTGSGDTICIKFQDLGYKPIKGEEYDGTIEMFALNQNYQVYNSLKELAESRLKKGKTLLGYTKTPKK